MKTTIHPFPEFQKPVELKLFWLIDKAPDRRMIAMKRWIEMLMAGSLVAIGIDLKPAFAQEGGNSAKGYEFAQRACATCHAIRKADPVSPNPLAPSFEKIANSPGVTGIALAAILHSAHENMPSFVLSTDERNNVIAYILTLKTN